MSLYRWCGLLLFVALAGCDDDGGSDAKVVFTNDGSGAEGKNLDPVQLGSVRGNFATVVSGSAHAAGYDGLREHEFVADSSETVIHTSKGSLVTSVGSPNQAVLRVPATVRVGMAWDVYVDGSSDPIASFKVTERKADIATPFGTGTVWTITEETGGRPVNARKYVEGFGRLDSNVAILDPQPDKAPARKALTLQPMTLPPELAFADDAPGIDGLSMVSADDDGTGVLIVASAKRSNGGAGQEQPNLADSGCAIADGTTLTGLAKTEGPPNRRTHGNVCASSSYCVNSAVVGSPLSECRQTVLHGAGARVGLDGEVVWTARRWNGAIVPTGLQGFGPRDYDVEHGLGTWPLAAITGGDGRGAMINIGAGRYPDSLTDSYYVSTAQFFGEDENPPYGRTVWATWPVLTKLDTVVSLGQDSQGREQILLRDAEHFVTWSRTEGDVFSHPRVGGRIGGRLSVHAERGHNDVLVISADGSVDRLALEADELVTYHLADVAIPAGEWAIGAFVVGGHLVVGTLRLGTVNNFGKNVHLTLYRSKESVGDGARVQIPEALTVVQKQVAPGIQAVCWRDNGMPVDPTTWTSNGAAPAFAAPVTATGADPCIVVGEAGTTDPRVRMGVVPGVGRVVVTGVVGAGVDAPPGGFDASTASNYAVLPDGSLISPRRRMGRGGVDLGFPLGFTPAALTTQQTSMADRGGAGYWVINGSPPNLSLVDATGSTPIPGLSPGGIIDHALSPTGVAVVSGAGMYFITPQKQVFGVVDSTHSPCWLRSDGAVCGFKNSTTIYCNANGTETTFPANGAVCSGQPAGPDRYVNGVTYTSMVFVDLVAGTATTVPISNGNSLRPISSSVDHYGRGFTTYGILNENYLSLMQGTPSGLQEIYRIPANVATAGNTLSTPNSASYVSTPDMLVLDIGWTSGDKQRYVLPPIPPP